MDPSDRQREETWLREAILTGSESAWETLYERHFDALYAYVYHRSGRDANRTDEIVQHCWLTVVRRIGEFDPQRAGFEQWLRGIAENVARNDRRRQWRDRLRGAAELDDAADAPPALPTSATEHRGELAELIALTFTELPLSYQTVLRAKYEERLSTAEIAGRAGRTPKAIESLLSRARTAFRDIYRRLGGDF
jgi:RNA polymerase sigma-70 factor (ECF subfamily)